MNSDKSTEQLALQPHIARHIFLLHEQRVILDSDLAALYNVETKVLIQSIKRNRERFPADFMFQLNADEFANLRSQFVTSSSASGYGGRRYAPYAFTEHGVAMLSSVLNSPRAIAINIEIMRAFVQVRGVATSHQEFAKQLAALQTKTESLAMSHESLNKQTQVELRQTRRDLKEVFDTLRELMTPPPAPLKRQIGFITNDSPLPRPTVKKATAVKRSIKSKR